MKNEIVYLACPYTHSDENVREKRYEQVTQMLAKLLEDGKNVFSPITMTHPAVKYLTSPDVISHEKWLKMDFVYLNAAKEMYVLMLDSWETSKGVLLEIEFAIKHHIPINFLDPKNYDIQD